MERAVVAEGPILPQDANTPGDNPPDLDAQQPAGGPGHTQTPRGTSLGVGYPDRQYAHAGGDHRAFSRERRRLDFAADRGSGAQHVRRGERGAAPEQGDGDEHRGTGAAGQQPRVPG